VLGRVTRFLLRARGTFSARHDRELRDELQLHLRLLEEEYTAQGIRPDLARQRAHREFGNATLFQETSHNLFSFRPVEDFIQDLRYATREMRRSLGFTCISVLSLAIGIGAVTAAFAVIDAFIVRGLPVQHPERLVAVSTAENPRWGSWPYVAFTRWRDSPDVLFDVAASSDVRPFDVPLRGSGTAGEVRVSLVSANYFRVMGVDAALGRVLVGADDRGPGTAPVAVISDAFWDRWFGRSPDVLTKTIELRGVTYDVVGVAGRGFTGHIVGHPSDAWIPITMQPALMPDAPGLLRDRWGTGAGWLRVIGRLRPGVNFEQAVASANLIRQRFVAEKAAALGTTNPHVVRDQQSVITLLSATTGYAPERGQYTRPLVILLAITAVVLLVACANFTSLMLARSESRRREFVIRLALGGGRGRLIRQSVTECIVLAGVAGVFGLLLANWTTALALKQFAVMITPIEFALKFDARVLAFASACVAVVIAFGLWPSTQPVRSAAASLIHQATAVSTRAPARSIARRFVLVAQLAMCTVLLIGAGLLLRTVTNLRSQDLGFDRNVLLVSLSPGRAGASESAAEMLLQRLRDRLLSVPGITAVGVTGPALMDYTNYWIAGSQELTTDRGAAVPGVRWTFADVGPGFFEAVGMSVEGRSFAIGDAHPPGQVVAINRTLAALLFGNESPLGGRIRMNPRGPWQTVIGVVNDVKQTSPRDRGLGVVYSPLRGFNHVVLAVRTSGPPAAAAAAVRSQLSAAAPGLPIENIRTIADVLDTAIAQERLMSAIALCLAGLSILLGCVGLYALMSYDVAQRTRELGIRLALGATGRNVVALVLRDSVVMVLAGLATGVPLGIAASRALTSQLYGVNTGDPWTLGSVGLLLVAVSLIAAVRPARTAARIDPIALLRSE
jgi:predicted permease